MYFIRHSAGSVFSPISRYENRVSFPGAHFFLPPPPQKYRIDTFGDVSRNERYVLLNAFFFSCSIIAPYSRNLTGSINLADFHFFEFTGNNRNVRGVEKSSAEIDFRTDGRTAVVKIATHVVSFT